MLVEIRMDYDIVSLKLREFSWYTSGRESVREIFVVMRVPGALRGKLPQK